MSDHASGHSKQLNEQLRASDGTFVKTKVVTKESPADADIDRPLVSVTLNNPFKKLIHWIDELRRKQSTTFSIQLKLPLVVILALFVVGTGMITSSKFFYDWGKDTALRDVMAQPQPTPAIIIVPTEAAEPTLMMRLGVLKGSYPLGADKPVRYMLEENDGKLVIIEVPGQLSMAEYMGKRILLTGVYDSKNNTFSLRSKADIELIR